MYATPNAGYVTAPPQPRRAPAGRKRSVGSYVATAVFVAFVIVALVVTDIGSQIQDLFNGGNNEVVNNPPTFSPTAFGETRAPTPEQVLFPNEIRSGDNYVGLFLLTEMSDAAFGAFRSAADRWSEIVKGTVPQPGSIPAGSNACGVVFEEERFFDHLIIGAQVQPIDGVNGILGSAGPCALIDLPLFGVMTFDSADIANLVNQGAVESVILHEMGHVLGIGTLWTRFSLLDDAVFGSDGSVNVNNEPKMRGQNAIAEYKKLTGNNNEQFVPVEDGTTNGQDIFNPKTNGAGSIDGHWDEDFFRGELMAFSIDTGRGAPPMSATTIASLADFGYEVDLSFAEDFSIARAKAQNLRGGGIEIKMLNDIQFYEPVQLTPVN